MNIISFKSRQNMPNCRISQFIQDSGEGKYTCFRTKRFSLDTTVSDELYCDDKKVSHVKKHGFAEIEDKRINALRISEKFNNMNSTYLRYLYYRISAILWQSCEECGNVEFTI